MIEEKRQYQVALFQSVSAAMKAESILKESGILYKIIPVPKEISTECGICVRFLSEDREKIEAVLASGFIPFSVASIC